MSKLIAASILSADFTRLGEEIKNVEDAGADIIHFDVMDGHFVPNLTVGPMVLRAVRNITQLPIDAHLMVANPDHVLEDYISAGANYLSVHVEVCHHLHRTLQKIKQLGAKAGVALNPHTPVSALAYILEEVDFVLVMTVNPGFGGQSFIPAAFKKVSELKEIRQKHQMKFLIEVDGGIKVDNIAQISQAGVNIFVAGSAIFNSQDYFQTIQDMKKNCIK
ncbi:MAG: ribulose-phosphate 3-epimerase [Deltaproteobacteria bacterium]|nr:ribulose-phosphate 3-epimerase [Deltaproteobacteria bacterium]